MFGGQQAVNHRVHVRPLGAEAREDGPEERPVGEDAEEAAAQQPEEGQGAEPVVVENPPARRLPDPGQPTPQERADHELTHLPFRPWCADCVAGRAPDDPHRRRPAEAESEVLKVSVDYGFIAAEGQETLTILVVKVSGVKAVMARTVKGKGRADPQAAKWLVEQLRRLGLGRCVLQADGEPAQRGFIKDVVEEACIVSNIGVAGAHSPAHDHQANGAVEKAVRDVKDQVRVMMSALDRRVGRVHLVWPVFQWLVAYAAELITGAQVGHDGWTAHRRMRGRNWEPRLTAFGEQVMARRPQARVQGDVEPRWDQVTYLGTWWGTAEHWVADASGTVRKVRTIRRMPLADRWGPERVKTISGLGPRAAEDQEGFQDRNARPARAWLHHKTAHSATTSARAEQSARLTPSSAVSASGTSLWSGRRPS